MNNYHNYFSLIVPDCHDRRLPDCACSRELSLIPATTSLDNGDTFLLGNIFAFHSFECRLTFLKIFDRFLFDFCDVLQGEE